MLKKILGLVLSCALIFTVVFSFSSCSMLDTLLEKLPIIPGINDSDSEDDDNDLDDEVDNDPEDDGDNDPEDDGDNDPEEGGSNGSSTPDAPKEVAHTVTVVDKSANAVAGAKVKLISENGEVIEKTTDANGKITVSLAGEWKAQLASIPAGYVAADAQFSAKLSFTDAKVKITVTAATYAFTVKDASGAAYAGATISLYPFVNGDPDMTSAVITLTTNENGIAYAFLSEGGDLYYRTCTLANADGYYVKDGYTFTDVSKYTLTVSPIPDISTNPIAQVGVVDGAIQLTYKDGTKQSLGTLPIREGYNSAAVSYDFDSIGKILTVMLVDSSSLTTASETLAEEAKTLTVCIREMNGKLEWASESLDDWQILCDAVTNAEMPLQRLASITGFGKHEAIVGEGMVVAINGNTIRFRARDWKSGVDLVYDAYLNKPSSNEKFNFYDYVAEISSTENLATTYRGAGYTRFKRVDDDIAPIYINGTYIGANHGYNVISRLPNNAGLTVEDIGSIWQVGTMKYVVFKATDTAIWFCPYYDSAMLNGIFEYKKISNGATITHVSGATHTATFTAAADSVAQQSQVAINHRYDVAFLNGTQEIDLTADGYYTAEFIDYYESYDIIYLPAVLEYLIANVGNNDNNSCHSDEIIESYVTVRNTFRFHKNGSYVVYCEYEFHQYVTVAYLSGGVQSYKFDESTHYVYVPGTTNYSVPTLQPEKESTPGRGYTCDIGTDNLADPDTLATSFFQFTDANGTKGINIGYNPLYGAAQNDIRKLLTSKGNSSNNLCWYADTWKLYPRLISGGTLKAGTKISCVSYCIPSYILDDDFTAINWYWVGDDIFLSLHTDMALDKIVDILPDYMNGMEITVIEDSDSFTVNSNVIEDGSISVTTTGAGYVILKLSNPTA